MSRTKWRIILRNIHLIDVPTRQNRMFLKIKNCVSSVITKSFQIVNNQCEFTDSVEIEVNFPSNPLKAINKNSRNLKVKPIRLSFRLENSSRSGFQRYGIVMIDLLKMFVESSDQITNSSLIRSYRSGLENCSEKPTFSVDIVFPQGFIPKNPIMKPSVQVNNDAKDTSICTNSTSVSNVANNSSSQYSSPKCSQSSRSNKHTNPLYVFPRYEGTSPSCSNSHTDPKTNKTTDKIQSCPMNNTAVSSISIPTLSISNPPCCHSLSMTSNSLRQKNQSSLDTLPIKITRKRYDELEGEIDNLLAGIINDESIQ